MKVGAGDEYTWFGFHPLLPVTVAKALDFGQEQPGDLGNIKLWGGGITDRRSPSKCSTGDLSGQTVNICATGYLYAASKQHLRIDPREAHSTEQHRSDSAQGLLGVGARHVSSAKRSPPIGPLEREPSSDLASR